MYSGSSAAAAALLVVAAGGPLSNVVVALLSDYLRGWSSSLGDGNSS